MNARRTYRVQEVGRLAGVSVRTLHYYEEIGLLIPTARTEAGYRLYTDDDLLKLQQILLDRELGLPLEEIRRALDDRPFNRREALLAQRTLLARRAERIAGMIDAVDAALSVLDSRGGVMETIFKGFDPAKYEAETRERWGDTDAYEEAARRTKGYTKEDWARHGAEQEEIYRTIAELMKAGTSPSDTEAVDVAERHRLLIDRWFYPCSRETHRDLAALYESDSRFSAGMDARAPGLTAFLVAAIRANATTRP